MWTPDEQKPPGGGYTGGMFLHDLGRAIGAFMVPLIWAFTMALALWLTRRYFPRAEQWLFSPLWGVIRRLAASVQRGRQEVLPPAPEARVRSGPRRVGRD
jgi:hypothetical protein